MGEQVFIQQNSLFSYSGVHCIRNDYYHHGCQICVDICPEDAFSIIHNKLQLDTSTCNACTGCIGSCPTEALSLKSFDVNTFVQDNIATPTAAISCKTNTPCLGVFDEHHFIILSLDAKENLQCDLSHCAECSVNKDAIVEKAIREKIDSANAFYSTTSLEKNIIIEEENESVDAKRVLFRKAVSSVKEDLKEPSVFANFSASHKAKIDTKLPPKNLLLNEAIKRHLDSFTTQSFQDNSALFTQKKIDFDTCTLCKDCVQFCPTEALFLTSDNQGIFFTHAKCIGCGICDSICQSKAIVSVDGFDLVSIAINRAEMLVHYELVRCNECKTPFAYRGGEPICLRCKGFLDSSADLFTLARDL